MKKLIQICSILSLLVAFSFIPAQASTATRYEANIPFDFNIGQKSYQSGTYVIRVVEVSSNSAAITIEDKNGNELQTMMVVESNNISKKQPQLVFNRYENQRFLSKIMTQESGILVSMSGAEKQIAKKMRDTNSNTQVAIAKLN